MISFEEAKARILAEAPGYYLDEDHDRSARGYVCPFCGSGSGENGTGLKWDKHGNHRLKCFAGGSPLCPTEGDGCDIIDIYQRAEKCDFTTAFNALAELIGINPELIDRSSFAKRKPPTAAEVFRTPRQRQEPTKEEEAKDFSEYFRKCAARRSETDYYTRRGISEETAAFFCCGFDPAFVSPSGIETTLAKGGNPDRIPKTPRAIIPNGKGSFLARLTRDPENDTEEKYKKQAEGRKSIFNFPAALCGRSWRDRETARRPDYPPNFWIVEGEFDAMSLEEIGFPALALCSTANASLLLDILDYEEIQNNKKPPAGSAVFVLLDADETGQKKEKELAEELKKRGYNVFCPQLPADPATGKPIKDPNDFLTGDRKGFAAWAAAELEKARQEINASADLLESFRGPEQLRHFENYLKKAEAFPIVSTGFRKLDDTMEGGLYPGLYFVGAISGLGKTSLILQIADQIAASGTPVLYFSLEMPSAELIAKTISRITYADTLAEGRSWKKTAKTTRWLLTGKNYKHANAEELEAIRRAKEKYLSFADNLFYFAGLDLYTPEMISDKVRSFMEQDGRRPVVIIDYLQIIKAGTGEERLDDKRLTDKHVLHLAKLARREGFEIPIIAISSFNRLSYFEPVDLTAFKESGAIEYTADCVIGVQYAGMDYEGNDTEKKHLEKVRKLRKEQKEIADLRTAGEKIQPQHIELKILKNRHGNCGRVDLFFWPAFSLYAETDLNQGADGEATSEPWYMAGWPGEDAAPETGATDAARVTDPAPIWLEPPAKGKAEVLRDLVFPAIGEGEANAAELDYLAKISAAAGFPSDPSEILEALESFGRPFRSCTDILTGGPAVYFLPEDPEQTEEGTN